MVLLYVLDRINDDLLYKYKLGNIKQITSVTEEYFCFYLSLTKNQTNERFDYGL